MDNIDRFYIISEKFGDDERLIAIAICRYSGCKESEETVWKELLDCEFDKWLPCAEKALAMLGDSLIEFIRSEAAHVALAGGIWGKGDYGMLTEQAWKLKSVQKPKSKTRVVKKRIITLFEYWGMA